MRDSAKNRGSTSVAVTPGHFKPVATIAMGLLLSACAVNEVYNPSNLAQSDLALLKSYRSSLLGNGSSSSIAAVYTESGGQVFKTSAWSGDAWTITLAPGRYKVIGRCSDGFGEGFPRVLFNFEAGKTYVLLCDQYIDQKALLGLGAKVAVGARVVEEADIAANPPKNVSLEKKPRK